MWHFWTNRKPLIPNWKIEPDLQKQEEKKYNKNMNMKQNWLLTLVNKPSNIDQSNGMSAIAQLAFKWGEKKTTRLYWGAQRKLWSLLQHGWRHARLSLTSTATFVVFVLCGWETCWVFTDAQSAPSPSVADSSSLAVGAHAECR